MKLCALLCFVILLIASTASCNENQYFGFSHDTMCIGFPIIAIIGIVGIALLYIKLILQCVCDVFHIITCCYFKKKDDDNPYYRMEV
jgi:hypothetical protein